MGKHVIVDVDYVECPYCPSGPDNQFKMLHWKHLKNFHEKKIDDVLVEFPGHPTMTLQEAEKKKQSARLGGQKTKATHNLIKEINCIHCNKVMRVKNNEANDQSCKLCLSKGLENPDGRTKDHANITRQTTLQEKHGVGVTNAAHIPGVIERRSETNIQRYGGVGFASEELAEKSRSVIQEKYGSGNIMKTDEGLKKFVDGMIKTYGVDNPLKILEIVSKMTRSLKRFFEEHGSPLKGKTYVEIHGEEKAQQLIKDRKISGAEACAKQPRPSKPQKELFKLVQTIFPEAKLEHAFLGYVMDIAIHDHSLCIEYDGSYWHDPEKDKIRDKVLEIYGWKTIRFIDHVPSIEELLQKINEIM